MTSGLLVSRSDQVPFARIQGQLISAGEFLGDVMACADQLPSQPYLVNLCQHRYWFMVAFFAVIARGQTNLLPSKRSASALQELTEQYPDSCCITDDASHPEAVDITALFRQQPGRQGSCSSPTIHNDHCAAIAFTSGSTGTPQAHAKTWAMLAEFRRWHRSYLPSAPAQGHGLVATVPAWHMYGLEWSMMLPSCAPITVHCGADFYPGDLANALNEFTDQPTLLVATPIHLKALLQAPKPQRPVATTLSATAPLDNQLSTKVSQHLTTEMLEIYGCSEIGSLAWRDPQIHNDWQFFEGLNITANHDQLLVQTTFLEEAVLLGDRFAPTAERRYQLLGRASDMVKVAGKRESLAHLNALLISIDGIEDGIIYDPASHDMPDTGRLAAVVVAPTLSDTQIRAELASHVDSAFIPRPIRRVAKLPRESTSKLAKQALTDLLQELAG